MWKGKIKEIINEKELYGEKVNDAAVEDEIEVLLINMKKELSIDIPLAYLKALKVVNGLEFNGYIMYGVDQKLLRSKPNQNIYGLIALNKIWHKNKDNRKYLFIGESNISWFIYNLETKDYWELDNPSGREVSKFSNFDEMYKRLLMDALI